MGKEEDEKKKADDKKEADASQKATAAKSKSSSSSSSGSGCSNVPVEKLLECVTAVNLSEHPAVPVAKQVPVPSQLPSSIVYNEQSEKPPELTDEQLAEAAEGINRYQVERNENFDTRFYRNQIAVRQHNAIERPTSLQGSQKPAAEEGEAEYYVIAKQVAEPKDEACWITVRQLKRLGSGRFSDVFTGSVVTGNKHNTLDAESQERTDVAIKKLWPDKSREDLQICTHRLLHHHNIVRLLFYYVCVHPTSKALVWMMILEPMPSTLTSEQVKYVDRQRLMPRIFVKLFTYQLMSGLAYMERKQVLHRDIKPDNLLVDMETGRLKIGDLGSSKLYSENCPSSTYVVTRYYRAPELCLKYKYYGPTVDVWSAGCILCGMLTNRIIFHGQSNEDQLKKIVRICGTPTRDQMRLCAPGITVPESLFFTHYPAANWYRILHRFNGKITHDCADFVTKVLRYSADDRLRGEQALKHDFFESLRRPGRTLPNGRPLPFLSP